jgi:hypothetical protein
MSILNVIVPVPVARVPARTITVVLVIEATVLVARAELVMVCPILTPAKPFGEVVVIVAGVAPFDVHRVTEVILLVSMSRYEKSWRRFHSWVAARIASAAAAI